MHVYEVLFYLIGGLILLTTVLAVTRRNLVHAVVYLVLSFFGTAMLFYLFGAPLLAALEVIIYAGAIMVLFLFIVMMLRMDDVRETFLPLRQWLPALLMAVTYLAAGGALLYTDGQSWSALEPAIAEPRAFGAFVFERHWLSIEIVSLMLLVALIGALHLGKMSKASDVEEKGHSS